jgi:hypothetical protein
MVYEVCSGNGDEVNGGNIMHEDSCKRRKEWIAVWQEVDGGGFASLAGTVWRPAL